MGKWEWRLSVVCFALYSITAVAEIEVPNQIGAIGFWHSSRFDFTRFCSGAQIGDRWILSAAHCFLEMDEYLGKLLFFPGKSHQRTSEDQTDPVAMSRIWIPQAYRTERSKKDAVNPPSDALVENDIALIELHTPLRSSPLQLSLHTSNVHWTMGYPKDRPTGTAWLTMGPSLDWGTPDRNILYSRMHVAPGASGSPLLSSGNITESEVVGVVALTSSSAKYGDITISNLLSTARIQQIRDIISGVDRAEMTPLDVALPSDKHARLRVDFDHDGSLLQRGVLVRNTSSSTHPRLRLTLLRVFRSNPKWSYPQELEVDLPFPHGETRYLRFLHDWSDGASTPVRAVWSL